MRIEPILESYVNQKSKQELTKFVPLSETGGETENFFPFYLNV